MCFPLCITFVYVICPVCQIRHSLPYAAATRSTITMARGAAFLKEALKKVSQQPGSRSLTQTRGRSTAGSLSRSNTKNVTTNMHEARQAPLPKDSLKQEEVELFGENSSSGDDVHDAGGEGFGNNENEKVNAKPHAGDFNGVDASNSSSSGDNADAHAKSHAGDVNGVDANNSSSSGDDVDDVGGEGGNNNENEEVNANPHAGDVNGVDANNSSSSGDDVNDVGREGCNDNENEEVHANPHAGDVNGVDASNSSSSGDDADAHAKPHAGGVNGVDANNSSSSGDDVDDVSGEGCDNNENEEVNAKTHAGDVNGVDANNSSSSGDNADAHAKPH